MGNGRLKKETKNPILTQKDLGYFINPMDYILFVLFFFVFLSLVLELSLYKILAFYLIDLCVVFILMKTKKMTFGLIDKNVVRILDRNSIMTLKAFHLNQEISTSDNSEEHQKKCHNNLLKVNEQLLDLQSALKHLFLLIAKEEIHFKMYGQYKMYNDPNFNPYLKS